MNQEDNPYEIHEKAWTISEVKQTIIEVHKMYKSSEDVYVKSLNGLASPKVAKSQLVSILYQYFKCCLNGFIQHIDELQEELNKREMDINITVKDYMLLPIKGKDYEAEKLIMMGYILDLWNAKDGYFKITHENKVFKSDVDMLEYYNDG